MPGFRLQLLRLSERLASMISALQQLDLLHMDLKPANLLLIQDQLRLADFGSMQKLKPHAANPLENTHVLNTTELWCALPRARMWPP